MKNRTLNKNQGKGPSQRQLRVGEQIRHIVADTLQRGHFNHESLLNSSITVSEVRISPDLKNASAYIMPLGGMGSDGVDIDGILDALNNEKNIFQKEIGRQSNLKFTPRLDFRKDKSFETAGRIEELIHEIHAEDKSRDHEGE